MKCPKCKQEIDEVIVVSECSQIGTLEKGTNEVIEYNELNVEGVIRIECPKCNATITRYIEAM